MSQIQTVDFFQVTNATAFKKSPAPVSLPINTGYCGSLCVSSAQQFDREFDIGHCSALDSHKSFPLSINRNSSSDQTARSIHNTPHRLTLYWSIHSVHFTKPSHRGWFFLCCVHLVKTNSPSQTQMKNWKRAKALIVRSCDERRYISVNLNIWDKKIKVFYKVSDSFSLPLFIYHHMNEVEHLPFKSNNKQI